MPADSGIRDRILAAARRRYYAEGVRATSADRLIADAGVSKVTFYRYFPTKDDLVVAYLEAIAAEERELFAAARASLPTEPIAVLDWYTAMLGETSCGPGFRGCPFINAAAEFADSDHPARAVVLAHRSWLTGQFADILRAAGVEDADRRAQQLMMLRDGATVAGYVDADPARVGADLSAAAHAIAGRTAAHRP